MKYFLISFSFICLLLGQIFFQSTQIYAATIEQKTPFIVHSIDTMKYSRDLAREKMNDSSFDQEIENQVDLIKETGATHIAINTPYDEEFVPILTRWVTAARAQGLSIWFRGNFSGWEGWFGYKKIDRTEHLQLLKSFISKHSDLFRDGDVFTPCPECENGGPGDPRKSKDTVGYNSFLIQEHTAAADIFHAPK